MPSIPLHPRAINLSSTNNNPLPQLLQTPSGLAILELQGTINAPTPETDENQTEDDLNKTAQNTFETPIGKLMFPDYSPHNPDESKWMKRVYLYVGRYQRMTGEVKKLPQPIAVVQRRQQADVDIEGGDKDELEIIEIVKYKIFFKNRPEPVNDN